MSEEQARVNEDPIQLDDIAILENNNAWKRLLKDLLQEEINVLGILSDFTSRDREIRQAQGQQDIIDFVLREFLQRLREEVTTEGFTKFEDNAAQED